MKKLLLLAVLITGALNLKAQIYIAAEDTSSIYARVDTDPQFPGGFRMFDSYIDDNSVKLLKTGHALGGIVVSFFVEKTGKVTSPRIIKGLSPETDSAAVYLVKNSPLWKPGVKNGAPVKTYVKIIVKFYYSGTLRPVHVQDVVLSKGKNAEVAIDEPVGVTAQNGEVDVNRIYRSVERVPEFPGGIANLLQFFKHNQKIKTGSDGTSGRVIVSFIVETDGSLTDIKVVRGISTDCDAEALRLLKMSPKWTPGTIGGKPVRVQYTVPVNFEENN
jgi:TonB family protein